MKKIFFPGVLLALLFIFSCTKDEFTEEKATQAQKDLISYQDSIDQVRDSLNMIGGIIQYSVSVIPVDGSTGFVGTDTSGTKSAKKAEMLSGAVVSVSQHGVVLTATTDESGIAVFYDLRVGTINVNVRATGYTTVSFVAEIRPENDPNVNVYYDVLRHAATMIPVFSLNDLTSNISGVVSYETDLTNLTPEMAEGVTVTAMIDIDSQYFMDNYFNRFNDVDLDKYNAAPVQIAYTDLIASGVTDANGAYSLDIPSAADGLPVKIEVAEVAVDQNLLLNTLYGDSVYGVQTVRTLFSTLITGTGYSGIAPSDIPDVDAAWVEFSAPTGVTVQQPIKSATAIAVIGESGIASIIIRDQGSGYTQPPKLVISGDGEGAEAVAYISEGKVTSIEITNPGKGYSTATVDVQSFVDVDAVATPVIEYGIVSYNVTYGGLGYQSEPEVLVTSSSGSGASAKAMMSGYVSNIEVTNMGSGYTCEPIVQIERQAGSLATASVTMTKFNPLHSVELSSIFLDSAYFETAPNVLITTSSHGSGATAVAQLSNAGRVEEIVLSNPGAGYTEAPTVLITGGGGMGAVAEATLNTGDGSISIAVLEKGSGYTSDPTIQISAPPAGGTAPVVDHVTRYFPISSITLTNAGSGYDIVDAGSGTYTSEPGLSIDGNPVPGNRYIIRPDMKVESIAVTSGGDGYSLPPMVTITPSCGYGSGAVAVAEILFFVESVEVVDQGSGYFDLGDIEVTVVTPPEGCTEQATAEADGLGNGTLTSIIINNPGMGYLAPPRVFLDSIYYSGSTNVKLAALQASVSNGSVTSISVGNVTGLSGDNDYIIAFETVTTDVVLDPAAYPQSGKISFVKVDDPGAGYTSVPSVKFIRKGVGGVDVPTGSFIDAEATAVVVDGRVTEINITNPGTGYYYTPGVVIEVIDQLRTAKGKADVNESGFIEGILMSEWGQGYSTPPTITFHASVPGMGAGATATAVVNDGTITKIVMTNHGSGYVGKNSPMGTGGAGIPVSIKPTGSLATFNVYAGKSYVRDIYLGTGLRNEDAN